MGGAPLSPSRARAGAGGRHWGRITVYCVAEAFEREAVEAELYHKFPGHKSTLCVFSSVKFVQNFPFLLLNS